MRLIILAIFILFSLQATVCEAKLSLDSYGFNAFKSGNPKSEQLEDTSVKEDSSRTVGLYMAGSSITPLPYVERLFYVLEEENDADVEPAIVGVPLVFKNPFRMSEGAVIGYELTKAMEVEIQVYNIFAHRVYQTIIPIDDVGGQKSWNEVPFNINTLNGFELPAGVYFYLIMHGGKVMGKGKMAIVP
jgi:hypothetical protein